MNLEFRGISISTILIGVVASILAAIVLPKFLGAYGTAAMILGILALVFVFGHKLPDFMKRVLLISVGIMVAVAYVHPMVNSMVNKPIDAQALTLSQRRDPIARAFM